MGPHVCLKCNNETQFSFPQTQHCAKRQTNTRSVLCVYVVVVVFFLRFLYLGAFLKYCAVVFPTHLKKAFLFSRTVFKSFHSGRCIVCAFWQSFLARSILLWRIQKINFSGSLSFHFCTYFFSEARSFSLTYALALMDFFLFFLASIFFHVLKSLHSSAVIFFPPNLLLPTLDFL